MSPPIVKTLTLLESSQLSISDDMHHYLISQKLAVCPIRKVCLHWGSGGHKWTMYSLGWQGRPQNWLEGILVGSYQEEIAVHYRLLPRNFHVIMAIELRQ